MNDVVGWWMLYREKRALCLAGGVNFNRESTDRMSDDDNKLFDVGSYLLLLIIPAD